MTIYYLSPMFREQLAGWKSTGVDAYFDMVIENSDPRFFRGHADHSPCPM